MRAENQLSAQGRRNTHGRKKPLGSTPEISQVGGAVSGAYTVSPFCPEVCRPLLSAPDPREHLLRRVDQAGGVTTRDLDEDGG